MSLRTARPLALSALVGLAQVVSGSVRAADDVGRTAAARVSCPNLRMSCVPKKSPSQHPRVTPADAAKRPVQSRKQEQHRAFPVAVQLAGDR